GPGEGVPAPLAPLLARFRRSPPTGIGSYRPTRVEDLQDEEGRLGPIKGNTDRAARNFLIFHFGESARIGLRPSGTEPKAKAYIEVSSPPCPAGLPTSEWQRRCRQIDADAAELADAFVKLCQG